MVLGVGPIGGFEVGEEVPAVLGGNTETRVAHFVDDTELVGDGELGVDGGADGLVIVGDGEAEGFAIQATGDEVFN